MVSMCAPMPRSEPTIERIDGLSEAGWVETTLTSRPMTSTPDSLQIIGPLSSGTKPSGRMPTETSRSDTPGTFSTRWPSK